MKVRHITAALPLLLGGCFWAMPNEGGGNTEFREPRRVDPADVALLEGYTIEPVVTGLTFPTDVAVDGAGALHVLEAGYSYGEVVTTPRLLRVEAGGATREVARGDNPPWNGVEYHQGAFYVAGGHLRLGQLLRIEPGGSTTALVDGLPGLGDHQVNGPALGPDGWLYYAVGTATNSAVVGMDNYDYGWLRRYPDFHDIPCRDVTLRGRNFVTPNPLTPDPDDEAVTGPYLPFGTPATEGQVVPGRTPCGGAIYRVRPEGGAPELVAWGFRNPFGLAWSPDGALYATDNQYDVRGSRPVFGTGDLLWRVQPGLWHGWPDFHGSRPLTEEEWFEAPGKDEPGWVLLQHPNPPPQPTARLGVHSSSNGVDFSRSPAFGYAGDAFVAQFGDMAPAVGKVLAPVGYRVVRVDVETGVIHDFAVNRGRVNGPASWLETGGLERPVSVRFDPSGEALYIVDFGVMTIHDGQIQPRPGTGVVWRVTRTGGGGR